MLHKFKLCSPDSFVGIVLPPLFWCGACTLVAWALFKVFLGLMIWVVQDNPYYEPPDSRFAAEGVRLPPAIAAAAAQVEDDEEVVGIEAFGKHRAYLLEGMTDKKRHIANDIVNGVPISITYCDLTGCVAAYANPEEHEPLNLDVAGLIDEKMALRSGGYTYFQEGDRVPGSSAPTDHIPYAHYPFVQTTWKKWREDHPDTDIYIGTDKNHLVNPYK